METEKLQIGVIVEDLDFAMTKGTELFGIGPWRTLDVLEAGSARGNGRLGGCRN